MSFKTLLTAVLSMGGAIGLALPLQARRPMTAETQIPLGSVKGRIDHLTLGRGAGRLFVAERGNGTVGVVDITQGKALAQIPGLREPQGLRSWRRRTRLYVASGGDGSVRAYAGDRLTPEWTGQPRRRRRQPGLDAKSATRSWPDMDQGALAVIRSDQPQGGRPHPAARHPESFQLDPSGPLVYVNLHGAHQIAVVDRAAGKAVASIGTGTSFATLPDGARPQGAAAGGGSSARRPSCGSMRSPTGPWWATLRTCGDADDVFVDARRGRIYVVCGEGVVDVIEPRGAGYASVGRIATAHGRANRSLVRQNSTASTGRPRPWWTSARI